HPRPTHSKRSRLFVGFNGRADWKSLQGFTCRCEGKGFNSCLRRVQELDVEQARARHAVELKADFGQAKTPAFKPRFKVAALPGVAFEDDEQVNVAPYARVAEFRAAVQIDITHAESRWVDAGRNAFREALTPTPVFRRRTQAFIAELALLPLQVLADAVSDIV